MSVDVAEAAPPSKPKREVFYRHTLVVRLTHWINAICFVLLMGSGLQIFNAYPRLHWGQFGANADTAFLEVGATMPAGEPQGFVAIAGVEFNTNGVLGYSNGEFRGFPAWATIPSWRDLTAGRSWHFFFAWVLVIKGAIYLIAGALNRHFQRDLKPTRAELRLSHILKDLWDHMRLRYPKGEAAKRYNILQKLAYLSVIFGLFPLVILTGLTMSPGFNAIAPILLDIFGGRQSARTLHFIAASGLVLFVLVHLSQVVLAGFWNELRSMITGRYEIKPETP